jgi:acyl-CoA thioesterase FadM
MVFGLEAMAQAVRAVTGVVCLDAVIIEDIELARPIIVSEENGVEIEIHALVLEQSNGDTEGEAASQIAVQIRTEQTDFSIDHFSAVFVLEDEGKEIEFFHQDIPEKFVPLDLLPEDDLYKGGILFQGPLYQKIEQVFQLDSKNCLFSIRASVDPAEGAEEERVLGDPFLRDTLLQSGQVPIPRDLCLPRSIQRIERFPVQWKDDKKDELILGKIVIEEHEREYVSSSVIVFNKKGQVLERFTGYMARIIDHQKNNPTAEELVAPGQRDQRILLEELKKRESILPVHCMLPGLSSYFFPCLQYMKKEERRKKELPFIKNALAPFLDEEDGRIEISWSQKGKPFLAVPADVGVHFSLTHNEGTIICSVGQGVQGCDLESIVDRSMEEWQGLLGEGTKDVLASLLEQGDSLQWAGTRLWTVFECIFKALGVRPNVKLLRLIEKKGDTVLFIYAGYCVLTFPVQLTLRAERMLAVVVPEKICQDTLVEQVPRPGTIDVGLNATGSITHEFTTTFLEGRGAKGKVYFTNIPVWMGELRELALLPIAEPLVRDMKSGKWGMVTNLSSFSVEQQLDSYDTVVGEVRLLENTDLSRSFLSLAFNWFKKQNDGSLIQAISGELATTWVKVEGHGKVKRHDLPDYVTAYFEGIFRSPEYTETPQKERHVFFTKASSLFTATVSTKRQCLLFQQDFLTSREDSNLVGNIYFSNYYKWQARVRDQYFARKIAEPLTRKCSGDFVCVHAEVYHLQEAMPYEIIEVSMYLYELFAEGCTLYFEYYSVSEHGVRLRKLAYGEHTALWIPEGQELKSEGPFTPMPEEYLTHFIERIGRGS